ncbi:MAG: hypothetical protein ACKPKO_20380, partial [Candidatus Fonsibacter sp.]
RPSKSKSQNNKLLLPIVYVPGELDAQDELQDRSTVARQQQMKRDPPFLPLALPGHNHRAFGACAWQLL